MNEHSLLGKTVLVTGGSRGIGAAVAQQFAKAGARVAITYASSEGKASEIVKQLESHGHGAMKIKANGSVPGAYANAVHAVESNFGPIDVVVANAGVFVRTTLAENDPSAYEQLFAVNVAGVVELVGEATKAMPDGGRVVLIGSINAETALVPEIGLYGASKAAVAALARGWARELGPRGITVNTIQPGPVDTDMNPADGEFAESLRAMIPLGRYGAPSEIAELAGFLASASAAFITGAHINIDGGMTT